MKLDKKIRGIVAISFVTFLVAISVLQTAYASSNQPEAHLILLWNESQPFYGEENVTQIPLLRILALSSYFPISNLSQKYGIKVSIVLSPATILDIEREINGSLADEIYALSEKLSKGENLTGSEELFLISSQMGLFGPLSQKIRKFWPKYLLYYLKYEKIAEKIKRMPTKAAEKLISKCFSQRDLINLCSMYNLYWLGKEIAYEEGMANLWNFCNLSSSQKEQTPFTAAELKKILKVYREMLNNLINDWKKLSSEGYELIPTSYSGAILPLLYDFGWMRDLKEQVIMGKESLYQLLGAKSKGFWLPGLAVNKEVLEELGAMGIKWTVISPGELGLNNYKVYFVSNGTNKVYLLIEDQKLRDYFLDNLFNLSPEEAAQDAIEEIEKEAKEAEGGAIVLALPASFLVKAFGSNSWRFLSYFYSGLQRLSEEGLISLVTPQEYLFTLGGAKKALEISSYYGSSRLSLENANLNSTYAYQELPVSTNESFPEYSLYGDLSPWIGNSSQNRAWVLLKDLRSSLSRKYSKRAYLDLLKDESSFYFYYIGKAGRSPYSPYFNSIFYHYLQNGFKVLGTKGPDVIYAECFPNGRPYYLASPITMSGRLQFIHVDGCLKEWKYYYLFTGYGTFLYISSDGINLNIGIMSNSTPTYLFIGSCWYRTGAVYFPFGINARMGVEGVINLKSGEVMLSKGGHLKSVGTAEVAEKGNVTEVKFPLKFLGYVAPLEIYLEIYFSSLHALFPYSGVAWYMIPIRAHREIAAYFMDPAGDDRGPGTYVYPRNPEILQGDFDLLIFKVLDSEDYVIFNLTFRTLGGNPLKGPNGFSFQVIQIYVQIAQGLGSQSALPGPNVKFKDFSWDFAIQAAGWPSYCYIQYYNGVRIHDLEVTSTGNSILVYVPTYEIGHPQKSWKYAVLVGCLLRNSTSTGCWMPVKPLPGIWNFGGANKTAYEEGIAPRVIDMLDPGNQYLQLSSYNITTRSLAAVTGVSFPEHMITQTPTITPGTTPSPTLTPKTSSGELWSYVGGAVAIIAGAIIVCYVILRRRRRK